MNIYIQPLHLVTAADLDEFIFLVFDGMLGVNYFILHFEIVSRDSCIDKLAIYEYRFTR